MTTHKETAPGTAGRLLDCVRCCGRLNTSRDNPSLPDFQPCIVTAVPTGKFWRVKVVGYRGETALVGEPIDSRLMCLGAAVLFANHIGGEVRP